MILPLSWIVTLRVLPAWSATTNGVVGTRVIVNVSVDSAILSSVMLSDTVAQTSDAPTVQRIAAPIVPLDGTTMSPEMAGSLLRSVRKENTKHEIDGSIL